MKLPKNSATLLRNALVVRTENGHLSHYKGVLFSFTQQPYWVCGHRHDNVRRAEACATLQIERLGRVKR